MDEIFAKSITQSDKLYLKRKQNNLASVKCRAKKQLHIHQLSTNIQQNSKKIKELNKQIKEIKVRLQETDKIISQIKQKMSKDLL